MADTMNSPLAGELPALLPCPFCGRKVDDDLIDTLYPSGIYRRPGRGYVSHKERQPGDIPCWSMHCVLHHGGCGAEISGDSEEETIAAWNRRQAIAAALAGLPEQPKQPQEPAVHSVSAVSPPAAALGQPFRCTACGRSMPRSVAVAAFAANASWPTQMTSMTCECGGTTFEGTVSGA